MKIMICYDGSNVAKDAMELAKQRAKALDGQIYLVRSMEGGPDVPKQDFDNAERELTELAERISKDDGIDCEPHFLVRGLTPGEDLVQFANEYDVDEIIIGVRKRSKVGKFLFGSTAQYVILEALCPVVSIK
jgi:nucleotide-binding universal stress UspA family protein